MSKKSRRRNKRLLALAGLAGAVALSRRKAKADAASTEDGKSAGFAKPSIADVSGSTKDTSKSDVVAATPKKVSSSSRKNERCGYR